MDNKEAIEYLKWIRPVRPYSLDKIKVQESIDLAIKALESEKTKESELIKAYTRGFDTGVETVKNERPCKNCDLYFKAMTKGKMKEGAE